MIAIGFLDLAPDPAGICSAMLLTCRKSAYVFDAYLVNRKVPSLQRAIANFLTKVEKQHGLVVKRIETDNELMRSEAMRKMFTARGVVVERSAPDTQAQNGGAERSGGVIKIKARALRIAARLPHYLWVEVYKAAVYLFNRTPRRSLNWQTPYEVFHSAVARASGNQLAMRKPKMLHLRNYGCRAYAITADALKKENRLLKLNPNAWIGYLVRYESTNIYRVWNPKANKVIRTRDVTFDEDNLFDGDITKFKDDLCAISYPQMLEILEACETSTHQDKASKATAASQEVHDFQTQEEDEEEPLSDLILDEIVVMPPRPLEKTTETQREDHDQQRIDDELRAHPVSSVNEAELYTSGSLINEADVSGSSGNEADVSGPSVNEADNSGSSGNEAESTIEVAIESECKAGHLHSAICASQRIPAGRDQRHAEDLLSIVFSTLELTEQDTEMGGVDPPTQDYHRWKAAFSAGRGAATTGDRDGEPISR